MRSFIALFALIILFSAASNAQDDQVRQYLKMVARGDIATVKNQLPDLLAKYPDDPGVTLLLGVVIEDALLAMEKYEKIVRNHPESQWADDAMWRIVQFHAVAGDTTTAKSELEEFRAKYPSSEYLAPATDVVRSAIGLARSGKGKAFTPPVVAESRPAGTVPTPEELPEPETMSEPEPRNDTMPVPEEAEPVREEIAEAESYGLQVGIYSSRDAATQEMKKYLRQRMYTEVREKEVDGEIMYAVVIGNYSTLESAHANKKIVKQQCGCNPIIFPK
ncbi:MAG: SPOR domain-containing protein [Candidatus Kapaibacterium sp.]